MRERSRGKARFIRHKKDVHPLHARHHPLENAMSPFFVSLRAMGGRKRTALTGYQRPNREVQKPDWRSPRREGLVELSCPCSWSPPPCSLHRTDGCVPVTKASVMTRSRGHDGVAICPVRISTSAKVTPGGGEKSPSGRNGELHFIKSPQMGAAAAPPVIEIGVLSS